MPFTDTDLKRLKELSSMSGDEWSIELDKEYHRKMVEGMEALLARLAAAENVCEEVSKKATGFYWRDSLENWRKAAGK